MTERIGVDEVGRGAVAGPVFVCAYAFRGPDISDQARDCIRDSKRISSRAARRRAADVVAAHGHFCLAVRDVAAIEAMNIRKATLCAMAEAVWRLRLRIGETHAEVLVDGRDVPGGLEDARAVVGGDGSIAEISCASILAKVARDAHMDTLAAAFPGFGFERHAGYGTPQHRAAIAQLGLSPHHRSWAVRFAQRDRPEGGVTPRR